MVTERDSSVYTVRLATHHYAEPAISVLHGETRHARRSASVPADGTQPELGLRL